MALRMKTVCDMWRLETAENGSNVAICRSAEGRGWTSLPDRKQRVSHFTLTMRSHCSHTDLLSAANRSVICWSISLTLTVLLSAG